MKSILNGTTLHLDDGTSYRTHVTGCGEALVAYDDDGFIAGKVDLTSLSGDDEKNFTRIYTTRVYGSLSVEMYADDLPGYGELVVAIKGIKQLNNVVNIEQKRKELSRHNKAVFDKTIQKLNSTLMLTYDKAV